MPDRVMPWYFATLSGRLCHGYGVMTDARALSFWQIDEQGVSLWCNVTNGGAGVELGDRTLTMARVTSRQGEPGEDPVDAVRELCRRLCARATRPIVPIYGANDWCYSYGRSTAASILQDTEPALDPTIPEAKEAIHAKLRQLSTWGYEMVKHDFSTYDLLGQWGFEMGPQPTLPGWSLHDRSRTNAEVIADLYALIREAVGPTVLLDGCNTVGHFGQGIFDLQRTGDDTSGRLWERTRRMGVNTLAFRLPQHGAFFIQDADVVGITDAVP